MFGGMFDPPHIGHVVVAIEASWQLGLDEVLLVVCARPPHREDGVLPADVRLRLTEAAAGDEPLLRASRLELDRPGPSFTVDTLRQLADDDPAAELVLIVGADQLLGFSRWHEPHRIVELARLGVVSRAGVDCASVRAAADEVAPGRVEWVEMPTIGVSSTLIRERLRAGHPVRHLVPPGVGDLVEAEGWYVRESAIP